MSWHGRCATQSGREPALRQRPRDPQAGPRVAYDTAAEPLPDAVLLSRAHNYKEKAGNHVTTWHFI